MDTNNGVVHSILQAKWNQFVSWWRNYFICICMHEAHCILNVTVFTWSHWTNPSPVELFNMQYMCLFLHSLSQTVVCRCCCTLTTTRLICHLSMANISVFNTTCWTVLSRYRCIVLHFLCPKTSFSSRWKDVGVFTISALGYWGKIWGMNFSSALPATYFLPIVRNPSHVYSSSHNL